MKSFSRVQKKGILTARAIENNRLNYSQNFDQMVEKQLEDDFKVHEYLNENPNEGHNTEEYLALFNTLLVKKFHKVQRKQLLKSNKAQLQPHDRYDSQRSESKGKLKRQVDTYYTEEQYLKIKQESEAQQEIIEEKTQQELQMKNVLLKEITENKKSLNLLKGDIGHMIARNQSISVLESKVNKVSLVSQNQLKRVSLALSKDKQQVQLRQQMQKKFHTKLKVVESLENRSLKKIKLSYIQTMKRRKQIFDNLSLIQKECASIEEYSDKLKQKEEKNQKSLALFRLLKLVKQSIIKSVEIWAKFELKEINCLQYCQELADIFKYQNQCDHHYQNGNLDAQIDQITEESLESLKIDILRQFSRLEKQIKEKKKIYKESMSKIEECWTKISHCDKKINQVIYQFNKEERNELNVECFSLQEYFQTFNRLRSNFNILYLLISFFTKRNKNSGGKQLVNQIYHNQCFHAKILQNHEKVEGYDELLCYDIESTFQLWFSNLLKKIQIWGKIPQQIRDEWKNKFRKQVQFNISKFAQTDIDNFSQSRRYQVEEEQQNSDPDENQNEGNQLINQLNEDQERSVNKGTKTTLSQSKYASEEENAKRIQILTKIDQSYYRMIKETIQMEKQNTMKNYEFKRSFKRNKYSSQDQLLEEKRFQATFSSLFKQDSDNISRPSKLKHESFKIKKAINGKSMFSSVHQTKSKKSLNNSCSQLCNKNSSVWEKQKRLRLRSKLKDVLSQT